MTRFEEAKSIYECVCKLFDEVNEDTPMSARMWIAGLKLDIGRLVHHLGQDEKNSSEERLMKRVCSQVVSYSHTPHLWPYTDKIMFWCKGEI